MDNKVHKTKTIKWTIKYTKQSTMDNKVHKTRETKINRVPDSLKVYVCTKFGQNPLKDVDSRVFTRMLCSKDWTR